MRNKVYKSNKITETTEQRRLKEFEQLKEDLKINLGSD